MVIVTKAMGGWNAQFHDMVQVTTETGNFSTAAIADEEFAGPAGYKKKGK